MKNLLAAAAVVLFAISAYAQPARDLTDANAAARQHMRDIEPALSLMRNEADALTKISEIQRTLSGTPLGSIDRAFHMIDDYTTLIGRRTVGLPHDQQIILIAAQRMLQEARTTTPADYAKFRDDFHHLIVHPLQLSVTRDMRQLIALTSLYSQLADSLRNIESMGINALNGSAGESTRQ
ncbi:MAG TPA: hypothetical protein VGQ46_05090 [Thermoanaerobaculia bacterium]|jgi:hypothetical protein|nr:hypothetical protein [Thermoanaerobaculia bacterium]